LLLPKAIWSPFFGALKSCIFVRAKEVLEQKKSPLIIILITCGGARAR
jgi:hypothetical protein